MDESADVRQSTVVVDGDLEALDRVREGLGVHSLQTLMTPPKEFVPLRWGGCSATRGARRTPDVRLKCGVGLMTHREGLVGA
jgi:hypothetical protein